MKVKIRDGETYFNCKNIKKSSKKKCYVTIIIRTKNEEKSLANVLDSVMSQSFDKIFDIIIIDSGSTDKTIEIANKYDLNIYTIPSEEFNFGTTISLGIELSNSDYCIFLSGHSVPANKIWLKKLTQNLTDKVVASYSKQTYKDDAFFIEKRALDSTFSNNGKIQKWNENYKSYSDYKKDISFSNASSCIKKEIALKFPFSDLVASEDREWALRILKEGYEISYENESIVYHYHNEPIDKYYKRIYINSKALYSFTNVKINFYHLIPLIIVTIFKDIKYMKKNEIKLSFPNLKMSIRYSIKYAMAHYYGTRK